MLLHRPRLASWRKVGERPTLRALDGRRQTPYALHWRFELGREWPPKREQGQKKNLGACPPVRAKEGVPRCTVSFYRATVQGPTVNAAFFANLEPTLSTDRIDAYRKDGAAHEVALGRYIWNAVLSESLYQTLQSAEIALRNAIHLGLTSQFGTPAWYDAPSCPLQQWQREQITKAKTALTSVRKPLVPGSVIAELSFGFWTGFFNRANDRTGLSFSLAKSAFVNASKAERDVRNLDAVWKEIKELRNRVFHHERIIHMASLDQRHDNILRAIGWLSAEMHHIAVLADRFPEVRKNGIKPWVDQIQAKWP